MQQQDTRTAVHVRMHVSMQPRFSTHPHHNLLMVLQVMSVWCAEGRRFCMHMGWRPQLLASLLHFLFQPVTSPPTPPSPYLAGTRWPVQQQTHPEPTSSDCCRCCQPPLLLPLLLLPLLLLLAPCPAAPQRTPAMRAAWCCAPAALARGGCPRCVWVAGRQSSRFSCWPGCTLRAWRGRGSRGDTGTEGWLCPT